MILRDNDSTPAPLLIALATKKIKEGRNLSSKGYS